MKRTYSKANTSADIRYINRAPRGHDFSFMENLFDVDESSVSKRFESDFLVFF